MATLRSGARTTQSQVSDILESDLTDDELAAHINAASFAVDDVVDAAAEVDTTIPDERLTIIETYLAAHYATVQSPLLDRENQESYSAEFLRETSYGDTAMTLDPTGTLGDQSAGGVEFGVPDARGIDEPADVDGWYDG